MAANDVATISDSFQVRQVRQEKAQMSERASFDLHHNVQYTGLPNVTDHPTQQAAEASFDQLLRTITNLYGTRQASNLTPLERFSSPSPTDAPFSVYERLGMEQNGIALGSFESLEQRTEMVKQAVKNVAATLRKADASDTGAVQGDGKNPRQVQ